MVTPGSSRYDLLAITGPTASGKTSLAAAVASRIGGEIISADSRQVYRGMNLGTGKDYCDFLVDGRQIPCHLIDLADPGYRYNVFEYQRDFINVYSDLRKRGVFPVVCGGSGMYLDSIVSGYRLAEVQPDPALRRALENKSMDELTKILSNYRRLHNTTDLDSKKRVIRAIEIEFHAASVKAEGHEMPPISSLIVGVLYSREARRERISMRLRKRLEEGMITEVQNLLESGLSPDSLIYYGLEYKYITLYLTGRINYEEMFSGLETAIHRFAKRQMTWFRGMERRGIRINWIDGELPVGQKVEKVLDLLL